MTPSHKGHVPGRSLHSSFLLDFIGSSHRIRQQTDSPTWKALTYQHIQDVIVSMGGLHADEATSTEGPLPQGQPVMSPHKG